MKKIAFLAFSLAVMSCHDHSEDRVVGNVHALYTKEIQVYEKNRNKDLKDLRKKIIDSMQHVFRMNPNSSRGWYSAKEMSLPAGVIIGFNPDDLNYTGNGPFYIIVRSEDGMQTICKTNRERWLLLQKGDLLK